MTAMPNQPKTPNRTIRIPDDLWRRVGEQARAEGTTASAVINQLLEQYVSERHGGEV